LPGFKTKVFRRSATINLRLRLFARIKTVRNNFTADQKTVLLAPTSNKNSVLLIMPKILHRLLGENSNQRRKYLSISKLCSLKS